LPSFSALYTFEIHIVGFIILHPLAGLLINPLPAIGSFFAAAISLVQAGLFFAIGIGLLKMQNWARVLLIVLSGIVLLFGVLGLMISVMRADASSLGFRVIAIAVSMLVYLFKPRVKAVFGATSV
jgi:hypothetical protein